MVSFRTSDQSELARSPCEPPPSAGAHDTSPALLRVAALRVRVNWEANHPATGNCDLQPPPLSALAHKGSRRCPPHSRTATPTPNSSALSLSLSRHGCCCCYGLLARHRLPAPFVPQDGSFIRGHRVTPVRAALSRPPHVLVCAVTACLFLKRRAAAPLAFALRHCRPALASLSSWVLGCTASPNSTLVC